MLYPIILNDGTSFHADYEVEAWLENQGFHFYDMVMVLENHLDIKHLEDCVFEKELIADGYKNNLDGLISEVEALADKLYSGRSGKGYTKSDIAYALKQACNTYEIQKGVKMGTDIHCMVEYRDAYSDGDKKWHQIRIENPYRTDYYCSGSDDDILECHPFIEPLDGRDYQLFGILAGVRSDDYPTIDSCRGIPLDVSEDVKSILEKEEPFIHSISWYTLKELLCWYNNEKNFHSVDYEDEYYAPYLDDIKKEDSYMRERFQSFIYGIEFIASLACYYATYENIRIVFWFDS